ncbi:MAG: hypothetical protein IJP92_13735, partial [Lachnospiraceae bacterium]|nr:hypothetical protein [Lachnospiraceae bacterium]
MKKRVTKTLCLMTVWMLCACGMTSPAGTSSQTAKTTAETVTEKEEEAGTQKQEPDEGSIPLLTEENFDYRRYADEH